MGNGEQPGLPCKWAMLDLNQRPPPCKLGQSFPGMSCPVGKQRLSRRFLPFLALLLSCSVQVCTDPGPQSKKRRSVDRLPALDAVRLAALPGSSVSELVLKLGDLHWLRATQVR